MKQGWLLQPPLRDLNQIEITKEEVRLGLEFSKNNI
jgi:hypothetical protein